jgi:hypothetical protein
MCSDKNPVRPEAFETFASVVKEVMQRIAAHVVNDGTQKHSPSDILPSKTEPIPIDWN